VLVYENGTPIIRPRNNILFTILHVTLFLLVNDNDVKTQKLRLNYETK